MPHSSLELIPGKLRPASLLDLDEEVSDVLDPAEYRQARNGLAVVALDLEPGPWSTDVLDHFGERAFALLVTKGLLVRDVVIAGNAASELLTAGDLAEHHGVADSFLPAAVHWTVAAPTTIALLDERLVIAIRSWPGVSTLFMRRAAYQVARAATHRAIAQLPRVEVRLLALFWHLAERWGRISPNGVIVPLTLTHETAGRLVGARRPTVSLALKELARQDAVIRRADGSWLLNPNSLEVLAEVDADAWQPADAVLTALPAEPVEPARPVVARASRDDELREVIERVRQLRVEHAARLVRVAATRARCEDTRAAIQLRRRQPQVPAPPAP
jgi:CRP/FNR family cyclic AMP-dependent transcriptional regulator